MRIFAKKSFMLRSGDDKRRTVPQIIQDIPDKFSKCPMFKAAVEAGDIEVLNTASAQKKAENGEGGTEKEQLLARAAELGQDVKKNTPIAKLREIIAEAEKAMKGDDNPDDDGGDGKENGAENGEGGTET